MAKAQRWYDVVVIDEVELFEVYDQPYKSTAISVSVVKDISYYRNTFALRKIWGDTPNLNKG